MPGSPAGTGSNPDDALALRRRLLVTSFLCLARRTLRLAHSPGLRTPLPSPHPRQFLGVLPPTLPRRLQRALILSLIFP